MDEVRVGFFDSGIGGLTVLRQCQILMPWVRYYYLGDNGNAPYGEKTPQQISDLTEAALLTFQRIGVQAAVLACNTATAVCVDEMRKKFSFPIVGMEPAVCPAAHQCECVLILCTPRTAQSRRLNSLCSRFPQRRLEILAADGLAGEIERTLTAQRKPDFIPFLPQSNLLSTCDPKTLGLVLGCTHYIYLRDELASFYHAKPFDGNLGTAKRLQSFLLSALSEQKKLQEFGIYDHQNPFSMNQKKCDFPPIFLGKWGKQNEKIYFLNKCF